MPGQAISLHRGFSMYTAKSCPKREETHLKKQALKAAFPHTIPVMMGYVAMGVAFGILFSSKGYHFFWSFLMSLTMYAGAMQFVAINLLVPDYQLLQIAFITLMVNARYLFYGLSLIDEFRDMGKKKYYMIFALTDETYALLCAKNPPPGVDRRWFFFFISFLNHTYWIVGCTTGGFIGSFLHFNTQGIGFAMTALFVVLLLDLLKETKNYATAVIGIGGSLFSLIVFGSENFLIPALAFILILLTSFRKPMERREAKKC